MNRPFLPLAAVAGPTLVTCQLCGAIAGGLQFFRAAEPPAGVLGVAQVLGLEACAACIQDAAQTFALSAPPAAGPSVGRPEPPKRARREPIAPGGPSGGKPRPQKGGRAR